jgi:hypothetical protein
MVRNDYIFGTTMIVILSLKGEILLNAVLNREPSRPLITVANHHSCKVIDIINSFIID